MNKEQIENAADNYAHKEWPNGLYECVSSDSFIAGAEWRINSVWHDTSEKPEKRRKYLAHCKDDRFHTFCDSTDWDMFLIRSNIKHWAYIDDLFPDKLKGGDQ